MSPHKTTQAAIWLASIDSLPDHTVQAWAAMLSAGEQQRHRAFIRAERQRQFVAGRMLLRRAVALVADVPVDAITLDEQLGRPPVLTLAGGKRAPCFSISHSGPWVACAVSASAALGLDLEVPDPGRDIAAQATQAFGVAEAHRLMALPAAERSAAFHALWCRAEARYKLGQAAAACYAVPHDAVAIALCSSVALADPPVLHVVEPLSGFVAL